MANYLTTLRGTIVPSSLDEIFTHSLAIVSASTAQVVATEIRDAWQAQWVAEVPPLSADFPAGVTYTEATAAEILGLADGKLAAAIHVPFSPTRPGTAVGEMLPSQTAIAISLTAGLRANGTPMRGRFYVPCPTEAATDANGLLVLSVQQRIADYMGQFISTLQASGHTPCVWSRSESRLATVDSIRVGNKFDTIRRRRNALPETYETRLDLVPQALEVALLRTARLFCAELAGSAPITSVYTVPGGYRAILRHLSCAFTAAPAAETYLWYYVYLTPSGGTRTAIYYGDLGDTLGSSFTHRWGDTWSCHVVLNAGDQLSVQNGTNIPIGFQGSGAIMPIV